MKRIELLDLWRSLAVLLMLIYHALWDLTAFGVLPVGTMEAPWAWALCYVCSGSFILISGAAARFSRDSARRGFFIFCAGLLVTAVTAALKMPVKFGILQLLGVCMMLYGALKTPIERICGTRFAALCLALFAATWFLTANVTVYIKFAYPFGLKPADFYSADYYPIFPWVFLFLTGACFGKWLDARRDTPLLRRSYPAALTFAGRHSLIIYLLHQPVLYGLCLLLFS